METQFHLTSFIYRQAMLLSLLSVNICILFGDDLAEDPDSVARNYEQGGTHRYFKIYRLCVSHRKELHPLSEYLASISSRN
jgi:hypothetical protein